MSQGQDPQLGGPPVFPSGPSSILEMAQRNPPRTIFGTSSAESFARGNEELNLQQFGGAENRGNFMQMPELFPDETEAEPGTGSHGELHTPPPPQPLHSPVKEQQQECTPKAAGGAAESQTNGRAGGAASFWGPSVPSPAQKPSKFLNSLQRLKKLLQARRRKEAYCSKCEKGIPFVQMEKHAYGHFAEETKLPLYRCTLCGHENSQALTSHMRSCHKKSGPAERAESVEDLRGSHEPALLHMLKACFEAPNGGPDSPPPAPPPASSVPEHCAAGLPAAQRSVAGTNVSPQEQSGTPGGGGGDVLISPLKISALKENWERSESILRTIQAFARKKGREARKPAPDRRFLRKYGGALLGRGSRKARAARGGPAGSGKLRVLRASRDFAYFNNYFAVVRPIVDGLETVECYACGGRKKRGRRRIPPRGPVRQGMLRHALTHADARHWPRKGLSSPEFEWFLLHLFLRCYHDNFSGGGKRREGKWAPSNGHGRAEEDDLLAELAALA